MKKLLLKLVNHLTRFKKKNSGFTLLEMLIVLIVVGLLMAIIIPNVSGQRDRIEAQAKENIAEILTTQVNTYKMVENDSATVTTTTLQEAGYLTEKQVKEAEKLLDIGPSETIPDPITVPST
ncbi:competence type IV pilus major pilin ComGC [Eremococcus coleocola]|uniref:Prepilin-type cleavage/methylation N-terminal domain protein n=1 Tax=Eremococcus coleocola ACS-139-V-Col8 TaxID=908337 RepID=E4KNK0_9LACT|nr:competence type IV pilus major pilin ComGC [Eremococcus coleocola]EFR31483.1 prepilin-type cleavage/methylation N-terminal domain protein [Eremococcus coleocola ACS-139-V-Col8]